MASEVVRVGMRTPWGTADSARVLAAGIGTVGTPGHGGVKLSAARNAAVPKPLRREGGWYEEDCDAAIPLYVFHHDLPEDMRARCTPADLWATMTRWYPDQVAGAYPSGRAEALAARVNVPLQGMSSDPERRALDATDAEADARMAEEVDQDAADGERCEPCKGFGLVRALGKNAGGRYKTLAGAHAAQDAGRAVDCPTCGGLGLVGLKVDEESADSETVPA